MRRRFLRLPNSDDDDDDQGDAADVGSGAIGVAAPVPQPPISLDSNPSPNPSSRPSPLPSTDGPVLISDDDEDFVDVPESLSSPEDPSPPPNASIPADDLRPAAAGGSVAALIDEFFRPLGLRLRPEWLESCVAGLGRGAPGFERLDVSGKARRCFEQFLLADMNQCGAGVLPANVHGLHKAELEGPFVLQVDEIVNISAHLRERYNDASAGPKRCLKLSMTDGVQRVFGMEYRPIRALEVLAHAGLKVVIRNVHVRRGLLILVSETLEVIGGLVDELDAARKRLAAEVNKPPRGKRKHGALTLSERASFAAWPTNNITGGAQQNVPVPQNANNIGQLSSVTNSTVNVAVAGGTSVNEIDDPLNERNYLEEIATNIANTENFGVQIVEDHIREVNAAEDISFEPEPDTTDPASEMDVVHASNIDNAVEVMDYPLILSDDKENPFTYLSCLFAKWATNKDNETFVRGKIKCFLTGVKGFQFKHRSTYELCVYVDDGSLISEVLIDHKVVENGIGYSPEEVTTALSSSDKKIAADMKETMKRFQLFLTKFEGIMLVEINGKSSIPVILEMTEGCSTSDARLLLRRLKLTASRNSLNDRLKPIVLSS